MNKPYIISASRREDIPALKVDWLLEQINNGVIEMSNKFTSYEISLEEVKFIIFWTKNPKPLMKYLNKIPYDYYFHFTLNYYPEYELNLPSLNDRIDTFIELSKKIGRQKVIWRFDPIIINKSISIDNVISRIKFIGDKINTYTNKLVFSFIDPYDKLKKEFKEINISDQNIIVNEIIKLNKNWDLELATCSESEKFDGILKNRCIDPELIRKIVGGKKKWIKNIKDSSQRKECGCIKSVDIGTYGQCTNGCKYCYAK